MSVKLDRFSSKGEALDWIMANVGSCQTRADAEKYLRYKTPDENAYQTKIMDAIRKAYPEAFVWKAAAGAYSRQGIPDVCAVIDGLYFGFEVKRPYFGVEADIQKDVIRRITRAGGTARFVIFAEDALDTIRERFESEKRGRIL